MRNVEQFTNEREREREREGERERMEMTQMRREDDDMIELHKTPGSWCRDDTLMEKTTQGGDDIVDRHNASAKTTQSRKKWWKNLFKHLKYEGN